MDQADTLQEEISRQGRIAYRRLVRAGALRTGALWTGALWTGALWTGALWTGTGPEHRDDRNAQIAQIKRQLGVEFRLRRTAPWASFPLRIAALEMNLAGLLRPPSLSPQQTAPGPAPPA